MDLGNKHIVIIGGSSGIGFATAQAAIEQGANVTIASRSLEKLEKAKKEINSQINIAVIDTSNEESIQNFFANCDAIDHLVITAATLGNGSMASLSVSESKKIFDNKFWGSYAVAKHALPCLTETSSITFFSGITGQKPIASLTTITAACTAIEGLTKALAKELAPCRVNAVSPGITATPIFKSGESRYKDFTDRLIIKRAAQAKEIAQGVLYLINNKYTTGQILQIDGGYMLS